MPTEAEIVDQLAGYCEWLEAELGAPMHRSRVVMPGRVTQARRQGDDVIALSPLVDASPRRSRRLLAIGVATLVAASLTAVYVVGRPNHRARVAPSVESTVSQPVTQPAVGSTTVPTSATVAAGYAPVDLPDDLVVWDVGWATIGGTYGTPFVEQVFGTYDATNTLATGMLIRIQSPIDEVLPGESIPRITVRGAQGYLYSAVAPDATADPISLMWVEGTREISVRARGMTLDEAVAMLDALQWRADASSSFEPSSISLPLVTEAESGKEFRGDRTNFSITNPDGPTTVNGQLASDVVIVEIGAPPVGSLPPEFVYDGERRADGSVVYSRSALVVEPDGTIVQILGSASDEPTLADQVIAALRPIDGADLTALVEAASGRVQQLPEVAASDFPEGRIVLRGGTAEWPLAICLVLDSAQRCRSTAGLQQMPQWQNSVLIDGRWFLVGRRPAADPSPIVFPWTPDLSAQFPQGRLIAPAQAQVVGDQLLWYAEIPDDVDAVGVGYLDNGSVVSTTAKTSPHSGAERRPDS
jgi:hypothetical protein